MTDDSHSLRLGTEEEHAEVARLKRLARIMDAAIGVPGTKFRIGWDPFVSLIPGVGDAASAMVSVFIVYRAARLGVSWSLVLRMLANVLIDTVLGSVPVIGDLFDVGWQANIKNVELLERAMSSRALLRRTREETASLFRVLFLVGWLFVTAFCFISGLAVAALILKLLVRT